MDKNLDVMVAVIPGSVGRSVAKRLNASVKRQWTKDDPIDLSQHLPHISLWQGRMHPSAIPHMIAHADRIAQTCRELDMDITIEMGEISSFDNWLFWWPRQVSPKPETPWWVLRRLALNDDRGFPRLGIGSSETIPEHVLRVLPEIAPGELRLATDVYGYAFAAFPHITLAYLKSEMTVPDVLPTKWVSEIRIMRLVVAHRGPRGTIGEIIHEVALC